MVIDWGDPDLELAASHETISSAFAISLLAHALLLTLPHPALWNHPAIASHATDIRPPALSVQLPASHHLAMTHRAEQTLANHRSVDHPTPGGSSLTASSDPRRIAPSPDYQLARALDRQVEVIDGMADAVTAPSAADAAGELLLRLIVDKTGAVQYLQTLNSTLSRQLESEIVLRFFRATYRPGEIDGKPVSAEMLIIVTVGDGNLPASVSDDQKAKPIP